MGATLSKGQPAKDRGEMCIQAFVVREDGHWAAVAVDYTVTGFGASREEAQDALRRAVIDYFSWCASEGTPPWEAKRPISRLWLLKLHAGALATRILRIPDSTEEGDFSVPVMGLSAC